MKTTNNKTNKNYQTETYLGFAKHYSEMISQNVKRALTNKIKKGEWVGKAPFGYENTINENKEKVLKVKKVESDIIKDVFKLSNKELNLSEIFKSLKEKYPNEIFEIKKNINNKYFIYRIIKNKDFYNGFMTIKGKQYPHKYERIDIAM